MLILFDHGAPQGVARALRGHTVITAKSRGWDRLTNGDLLKVAETAAVDVLFTTDQRMSRTMWHLTVSQPSGRIFVSGIVKTPGGSECGTYEITPDSESPRKLLTGAFPDCGGGRGEISPDGKRVLGYLGGHLCVTELETGAIQVIPGLSNRQAAWSPNGKWIATIRDGGVIFG